LYFIFKRVTSAETYNVCIFNLFKFPCRFEGNIFEERETLDENKYSLKYLLAFQIASVGFVLM
jgi:hypothetical protein